VSENQVYPMRMDAVQRRRDEPLSLANRVM